MKLVVAGASGFVASETIKQTLLHPEVTSLVTLSRRPVSAPAGLPPNTPTSKLQNVVIKDYEDYSPEALEHLKGADACIWTIAILAPLPIHFTKKASNDEIRKVSVDYAVHGLKSIYEISNKPFRFVYVSGHGVERDRNVQPSAPGLPKEYCWIRGEAEAQLLDFKTKNGGVSVTVVRPSLITPGDGGLKESAETLMGWALRFPIVSVREIAATMIARAVTGAGEGDTLSNDDLVKEGRKALEGQKL